MVSSKNQEEQRKEHYIEQTPFIFQPIALLQSIVHEVSQIYFALPLFPWYLRL